MRLARKNAAFGTRTVLAAVAVTVAIAAGCSDRGADITRVVGPGPAPGAIPVLSALVPARTVVGDTVRIAGVGFGSEQASRTVLFPASSSGTVSAQVLAWTSDTVRVLVPAGAGHGSVVVQNPDSTSNGLAFETAPRLVPYSDVNNIFIEGTPGRCTVCHAPVSGNPPVMGLDLSSWAGVMAGSQGGPGLCSLLSGIVVHPRHGAESALVQRLDPSLSLCTRMPQYDNPLSDSQILLIRDWIDQGARP